MVKNTLKALLDLYKGLSVIQMYTKGLCNANIKNTGLKPAITSKLIKKPSHTRPKAKQLPHLKVML